MKVIVNGAEVAVGYAEATISTGKMTRQFTVVNYEEAQTINEGDTVEIHTDLGIMIVRAEVEYIQAEEDGRFTYAGRNEAKHIADSFADKTIQFTENQTVQAVLDEIAGAHGLKVNGQAGMPQETVKTVLIGERIGLELVKIANAAGQIITSDATGNLIIESQSAEGDTELVYGQNIRKRIYTKNNTNTYNKYVVCSQSNYIHTKNQETNVQGIQGSGSRVKVIVSEDNLTETECEEVAKAEKRKDYRKAMSYEAYLDADADVKLSHTYKVTDASVGLNERLNVKRLIYRMGKDKDETIALLERV